jgi:hypothetical protein
MTLNEKIAALKVQYPTLSKGVNDEVIELTQSEYDEVIAQWAKFEFDEEQSIIESTNKKSELLERLGITADEAKLLLG